MSRVANNPITIPSGVDVTITGDLITAKNCKSTLVRNIHAAVVVTRENDRVRFSPRENVDNADALAGTARSLFQNMMIGLSQGHEKRLILVGVGYRAQLQGEKLALTLGFSHPVEYKLPDGISIEMPSQTEIVIKGIDKQLVGQVAAEIRSYRPPEPYKGKGVRYSDEHVVRKEGKKK